MAIKTSAELKAYFETGDTPTQAQFEDLVDSTYKGYKVYTALLTQTGTNAPVATVLENTLGQTPTWYYDFYNDGIGRYQARFASEILTENKTIAFVSGIKPQTGGNAINSVHVNVYEASFHTNLFDEIAVTTLNGTGSYVNGILQYTALEVRVYL